MSKFLKKQGFNIIAYGILIFFALAQVFPFYLQVVYSLQPQNFRPEYGKLYIFPEEGLHFDNYVEAFKLAELGQGLANTLIAATLFTLISLVVVLVVGYVLGKKEFKGKKLITIILLATMMIPGEILMVPNYFIMIKLKWLNELKALFLPGIVNIFGIFLVKQYMNTIPNSLLESAELDGCGELKKIRYIILPLSMPIVGTYCILTFIAIWNDYLWPMIILRTSDMFTLQLKLMNFSPMFADARDQILHAAGLISVLLPVIIIFIFFQRYFIKGVSTTGIK